MKNRALLLCMRLAPLLFLFLALSSCLALDGTPPTNEPLVPTTAAQSTQPPAEIPPAAVLLTRGLHLRAQGEDEAAALDFSALLAAYPDTHEALEARFYLGESFARRGRWNSAIELFRALAVEPYATPLAQRALFWLALGYENAGNAEQAIAAYERYRALNTVIEPYAARRQADQLTVLGRSDEAADALLHVVRSPIAPRQRATAAEQAIATLRERGDANAALAIYRDVLAFAEQPAYRARTLVEAANLASSSGNFDQAIEWLLAALSEAPPAAEAVSALDALAALGVVPPDSAAAVEVYLAAERYQDALALAERALVATPGNAALLHLRGLARRGLGDFPTSLADLSAAGTADPNGAAGRQAQLDWIQTLGQSGDAERASAAYQEFAAAYSDDSRAPEALDRAAQLRDRLGDPVAAAQIYEALGRRFPQSTQGRAALHRLALQRFRSDEFAGARELWQILADNNNDAERARGAFWAGRAAAALGDSAAAEFYRVARSAAPESYYATRAAEELGEPFGGALALATPLTTADWQSLQDWIATWAGTPPVQNDDVLANYLSRAEELYAVGLLRQAGDEWLAAINAYQLDAYALATIAQAAVAAEQPDIALRAAQHLPTLAPTVSPQPAVLLRLRFPAPYNEAVREQSATYDLDPRLFLALMRQESLFDADATSWVGARGLAQVMPETGAWIAQQLTMHDFTVDDLYRPALSIRFGSYYLSERIANMNGSAHGALAAYNGGLGNAMRWAGGETVADPDLFVETIDFPETKGYVQAVYGFYGVYQDLYAEEN